MVCEMPVRVLHANSRTRKYRRWLEKCVVFQTHDNLSALAVETDLRADRSDFAWVARPLGDGKFLAQAPAGWRDNALRKCLMRLGKNMYEVKDPLSKEMRGLLEPAYSWVLVRGLPPDWSNCGNLKDLLGSYGYVCDMDWYNSENLDLRYLRVWMVLPNRLALPSEMMVVFVDGGVVEGMAVVSLQLDANPAPNYVPCAQSVDEAAEFRAILDDMERKQAERYGHKLEVLRGPPPGFKEAMKGVAGSSGEGSSKRSRDDITDEYFKLQLLRVRLHEGYNGTAGTGRVWVHPEQITQEVRAIRRRIRKEHGRSVGGAFKVPAVKRGRGRPSVIGARISELGPRLGNSSGVPYSAYPVL